MQQSKNILGCWWFFAIVLLSTSGVRGLNFCQHNDTIVRLINNGYETIGVWIDEKVTEDYEFLSNFQDLISRFSAALYNVTRKRAYIRNVQILIPHSWSPPDEVARLISSPSVNLETESQAQIWIKNSSPRNGTRKNAWKLGDVEADIVQPYVIKTTPCGFPGSYVRISPEFIRFGSEDAVVQGIGPPEKILAREWAKLRWGVYDELPRTNAPSNYYLNSNLAIQPILCSSAIPGNNIDEETLSPGCNVEESLYDKTCRFEPSREPQSSAYASLLYRADIPHVQEFCDDAALTSAEQAHNVEAPTIHNLHCRGRSIWDVMRNHPDFADGNNPPSLESSPPATNFALVQHENERIVLVLDVSSSMRAEGRLELLRQAVSHFIDTVPQNTYVGMVCFAWQAIIKVNLTQIRHDEHRRFLKQRLVDETMRGTSIGSGILEAIKVLKFSGPQHLRGRGGSIIILTDGREHNRPKINDTLVHVEESGATVSTIALGPLIASDLESLATVSGGRTHAASSGEFGIDSELEQAFSSHQEHIDGGVIQVLSEEISIPQNSSVRKDFVIDDSIGENTRITLFYNKTVAPLITIRSPSGKISTLEERQDNIVITQDEEFRTIYVRITDIAEVGTWTITVRNQKLKDKMVVRVNAVSYQRDEEPLVISPALLCRFVDFSGSETVIIYAYLSKGELAVLSALVYAEITRPLTSDGIVDTSGIFLRDDGLDPDVTPNDGVYSAYFTSFTTMGRYNVKVYASDNSGQASLDSNYILGIGDFQSPSVIYDTRHLIPPRQKRNAPSRKRRALIGIKLPPFQRVSSAAGAFFVQNFNDDGICSKGYRYFQDSCYNIIDTPLPADSGKAICNNEGGNLAILNSRQELAWLLGRITDINDLSSSNAWFGGVDEKLRATGDLNIEKILPRMRRGNTDIDLDALASTIGEYEFTDDMLTSFDPDLHDLSTREINRLLATLGLDSERDLRDIANILSQNKNSRSRWKRQILLPPSSGEPVFPAVPVAPPNVLRRTETTTPAVDYAEGTSTFVQENASLTDEIVLSQAKKEPDAPQPVGSGADKPSCSWFQNGKIIESSGDICNTPRKVICEKPKRDRLQPSRILDLKGRFDQNTKLLNLTWSAPGDDLNVGRASRYEIRTLRTRKALETLNDDFGRGDILRILESSSPDGLPALAGTKETVTVNMTESTACSPHGVLDILLVLHPDVFGGGEVTGKKKLSIQFIKAILENFRVDEHEAKIAALSLSSKFESVFQFTDNFTPNQMEERLNSFASSDATNRTLDEAVQAAFENSRRNGAAKVMLIVTDGNVKPFSNISTELNVTKIIVSISKTVDKFLLQEAASSPSCMNSFIVDDEESLPSLALIANVTRQLCQARIHEYQVIAVRAYDEEEQSGDSSNTFSFMVENIPSAITCPELEVPPALASARVSPTVVGLSVGIPVFAILAVVGSVMLFGQIKKFRKKRRAKQRKQAEERKIKEMKEARQRRAAAKAAAKAGPSESQTSLDMTDIGNKNNNNNSNRKRLFGKWRTAPLKEPPV